MGIERGDAHTARNTYTIIHEGAETLDEVKQEEFYQIVHKGAKNLGEIKQLLKYVDQVKGDEVAWEDLSVTKKLRSAIHCAGDDDLRDYLHGGPKPEPHIWNRALARIHRIIEEDPELRELIDSMSWPSEIYGGYPIPDPLEEIRRSQIEEKSGEWHVHEGSRGGRRWFRETGQFTSESAPWPGEGPPTSHGP